MPAGSNARARAGIEALVHQSSRLAVARRLRPRARRELQARDVGLVCLAGFMRLVGAPLLDAFPERDPQHPSVAAALVPRPRRAAAGARARRAGERRDGAPRDRRARRRSDRPAARRAGARRRHARRRWRRGSSSRSIAPIPRRCSCVLDGGWRIEGRRFVAIGSDLRAPRQREERDFGRAVDPHRHVDRSDAAADEDRRVVLRGRARRSPETVARAIGADARERRPGRRACGPTAQRAHSSAAASVSRRGSCASSSDGVRRRRAARARCPAAAASRSGCRPARALRR